MMPNEYQKEALRTEGITRWNEINVDKIRLMNGLMGLNGEAGEAIDVLKKHLFQGHLLDRSHMAEELGDVAWYLAISADALGYTLEDILRLNIRKLRDRYPDGFNSARSVHRKEGDL